MIAILLTSLLFGLHTSSVQTRHVAVRPWTIKVRSDSFTGAVTCSARSHDVIVNGPLAVFQLGADVDATSAIYRLDLGAGRPARGSNFDEALASNLARKPRLTNASGGRLGVPSSELLGVKRVDIRTSPSAPVRTFDVSGLGRVRDAELAAGCQDAVGVPQPTTPEAAPASLSAK